ncbi:hypothetical protein SDC9_38661 [bioreactor metagenome]|jgi:hypothetical protein|uniref:BioF2-like acetyltransferase domain-containing protein n=1 Tax=bioreactor metagenome TaxID=1076179 RepID=A0A644VPU6_9ZZZZ|nr:hypothetical protein [Paludibacter sp.]
MLSNKERYRLLCEERDDIPLFMQAWWMDAACGEKKWDVFLYEENGEKIIASFVYHFVEKLGFKLILNPQLTQVSGLWIDYPQNQKLHKRYSFEKKIIDNFIAHLESLKVDFYSQNFHYSFKNWQPFYWKGFKQTTYYTYQIRDLSNLECIFQSFSTAKQKHIKKENNLQLDFSFTAESFYNFHKKCLLQKNEKITYSQKLFLSIYNEAVKRDKGKIFAIKDKNELHAALFVVWDTNSAYALISAISPQFKNDGSSTKIFWEAIKFITDKTKIFDFEGSMIEGVAQSFQQFGTEQIPYFNIEKSYSRIFSILKAIKK